MLSSEPSDNFSGHRFSLLEAERVVLNVANNLQFLWAHMFFVLGKVFYFQLGKGLCSLTSWGSPTASLGKCSLYYGLLSQQNTLPMQLPLVLWKEFYQKITCSLSHIYGINYKYKRKTHTHTHPELSGLRPSFNLKHSYFWMPLFFPLSFTFFPCCLMIFFSSMLVFLSLLLFCICCSFLISGYHGVPICWPISICFKQVVL